MTAIGIAISGREARAAFVSADGVATLCSDRFASSLLATGTAIGITSSGCVAGESLRTHLEENPQTETVEFEDLLADRMSDAARKLIGGPSPATTAAAVLLAKLRADAEHALCQPVQRATFALGSEPSAASRHGLHLAAARAGLKEIRLVDSIGVALKHMAGCVELGSRVLCVDLGADRPRVTIAEHREAQWSLAHTTFAERRRPWQRVYDDVAAMLGATITRVTGRAPGNDPAILRQLRDAAVRLCQAHEENRLSYARQAVYFDGRSIPCYLSPRGLAERCRPVIDTILQLCEQCLRAKHLAWNDLDHVVLLGPLCGTACFREQFCEWSALPASRLVSRDAREATAFGCALVAAGEDRRSVTRRRRHLCLLARNPNGGKLEFEELFSGETTFPAEIVKVFSDSADFPGRLVMRFLAWEASVDQAESAGALTFQFATQRQAASPLQQLARQFRATLACDAAGQLSVSVHDSLSGETQVRKLTCPSDAGRDPSSPRRGSLILSDSGTPMVRSHG